MIRHVVMWTFAEEADGRSRADNLATARERLERLPALIPGIRRFELGIDELRGAQQADLVLIAEFDDWPGLDAYVVHPAHQEVVTFFSRVRDQRWAVDYEIET
jgi:hypothetical protein